MQDERIWQAVCKQRIELADFLGTLSDEEWDSPTLCDGWLVRDVAAHIVLASRYTLRDSLPKLIRHGLRLNKFMFIAAQELGRESADTLISMLRADSDKRVTPFLTKPVGVLADMLVHEQDIRLAIYKERQLDRAALSYVLNAFSEGGFGISEYLVGVHRITKKLRFIATDIPWKKGDSELIVEGKAQDLLVALSGRSAAIASLRGNGVDILSQRICSRYPPGL